MMYDTNSTDLFNLERMLLEEIEKEKKFTFRKFVKLLELNALMGR